MQAEIVTATTGTPAIFGNDLLTADLFNRFIKFVDRTPKTTRTYLQNLKQFAAYLRYKAITAPQRIDILNYRDFLDNEHPAIQLDAESATGWSYRTDRSGRPVILERLKAATIKLYLQSVKALFKWTASEGIYPNIAENIHGPKVNTEEHKREALDPAAILEIENSINTRAAAKIEQAAQAAKDAAGRTDRANLQALRINAIYQLATNAGLRVIEISRANVEDLAQTGKQFFLYVYGKGRSEADQKKPIAREVAETIKKYLQARPDGAPKGSPLFVATGNRSGGKRIAPTTISGMLKASMKAAGYDSERITAHSLRHSVGTAVQELNGDIYQTQQFMRHRNPATTEIYLHCETEKEQAEIAENLYKCFHGIKDQAPAGDLQTLLKDMTPAQLLQLESMARAMAAR